MTSLEFCGIQSTHAKPPVSGSAHRWITLHTLQWQPLKSTIHLNMAWLHCTVVLVRAQEWPEESKDYTSMKDLRGRTGGVCIPSMTILIVGLQLNWFVGFLRLGVMLARAASLKATSILL